MKNFMKKNKKSNEGFDLEKQVKGAYLTEERLLQQTSIILSYFEHITLKKWLQCFNNYVLLKEQYKCLNKQEMKFIRFELLNKPVSCKTKKEELILERNRILIKNNRTLTTVLYTDFIDLNNTENIDKSRVIDEDIKTNNVADLDSAKNIDTTTTTNNNNNNSNIDNDINKINEQLLLVTDKLFAVCKYYLSKSVINASNYDKCYEVYRKLEKKHYKELKPEEMDEIHNLLLKVDIVDENKHNQIESLKKQNILKYQEKLKNSNEFDNASKKPKEEQIKTDFKMKTYDFVEKAGEEALDKCILDNIMSSLKTEVPAKTWMLYYQKFNTLIDKNYADYRMNWASKLLLYARISQETTEEKEIINSLKNNLIIKMEDYLGKSR